MQPLVLPADLRTVTPNPLPAATQHNAALCSARRADAARPRRLARPQRIMLLLLGVWALNLFDLGFTLAEANSMQFVELNPIAASLLGGPPYMLVAYKVAMLMVGTIILWALNRHAVAELGCWFLIAACTYVVVRWYVYYECVVDGRFAGMLEPFTLR